MRCVRGIASHPLPIAKSGKQRFKLSPSISPFSRFSAQFPVSGYHMAVVAGVMFFAVPALLALIPALTVGFPIKKWSAAAALAAAAFYLLLSGAEVATQRSFFMTAVVLIAVMVDRRAVTFRTLAVAAMIVLALAPEALVHPSLQNKGRRRFPRYSASVPLFAA
jgi:lysylphosphatidylglycerol synthetase-like protein (DUF2156 family)